MTTSAQGIEPVYSNVLKQELDYVGARSDAYLLHDHLEDVNDPIYFHEFVERADARGLQFVSEVQSTLIATDNLPPLIANGLRELSANEIEFEQFMDFALNRRFRQSVLCRAGKTVRPRAGPDDLERLYVAANNTGENALAETHDEPLLRAAFCQLYQVWPLSIPFESLLQAARSSIDPSTDPEAARRAHDAQELKSSLIRCFNQKRLELSTIPPSFVASVSEKPIASPLARLQARAGNTVTNLRHEAGQLNEFGREVLSLLDGNHDNTTIVARLIQSARTGADHA